MRGEFGRAVIGSQLGFELVDGIYRCQGGGLNCGYYTSRVDHLRMGVGTVVGVGVLIVRVSGERGGRIRFYFCREGEIGVRNFGT